MNVKTLEYMIAIAEEKSISRAAERYYLSQPVMSRHLKNVESETGVPLFERGKDGMNLTREGMIFMNKAQMILHIQSDLEKQLRTMKRQQKQRLHLMIDAPYYNFFIYRVLPKFKKKYPEFALEFSSTNATQAQKALQEGKTDIALFSSTHPISEMIEYLVLLSCELEIALSDNCSEITTCQDLHDALKQDLIAVLHPAGSTLRIIEENCLDKLGLHPPLVMECADFQNIAAMLEDISGFGCLPKGMVKPCQGISQFPMPAPCTFYLVAAYSKHIVFNNPIRELIDILGEEYNDFFNNSQMKKRKSEE